MSEFDSAWLKAHEARMAGIKRLLSAAPSPAVVPCASTPGICIEFVIPRLMPTLNVLMRMHWRARHDFQRGLSDEIAALTRDVVLAEPIERARVTVTRVSLQQPDADNLAGGCKLAVDCLLPYSNRRPVGLGFCVDDDPAHMVLVPLWAKASKRAEQRTVVCIEALS